MSQRVVIDPITRIEGHLRIEVEVDQNNVIQKAYSSSTLFRGIEIIMKGRTPFDAGLLVQRICGVCTFSHYRAGTEAVENALGVEIPYNAKLIRSLMQGVLFMHDHLVHFYFLHGLDWVNVVDALKADPKKAAQVAMKYSKTPIFAGEGDLIEAQQKVQKLVDSGRLGPFANAYWDNKTYKFSPEQNLIALSHYLHALEVQRVAAQAMAIFGGKNPHPQSLVVGGVTSVRDMLSPARLQEFKAKVEEVKQFVDRAYQADILMAADAFKTEPSVLGGCNVRNFMSTDELFTGNGNAMLGGYIQNSDLTTIADLNKELIKEDITHSWYKGDKPLNPFNGETIPEYTDMIERETVYGKLPTLNENGKYSWVKAPRYNGEPVEVGPLASVLVNYAKGQPFVKQAVDELLQVTGLPVTALFTTLGRTAARMVNCRHAIAAVEETWESLVANVMGDETTYVLPQLDKNKEYKGMVFRLAPRGVLSHWVRIKDGVVENYQAVVPTTWNASPIDGNGKVAPYEASLVGLKLEDPKKPLEVLRVIHSFDPCMACAVHVMDYKGNELGQFRIDPNGL